MAGIERFKLVPEVHLFLLRAGRILLSRRANTGYADGLLSVVAGHMDGAETARQAICREAAEEVGIGLDPHALDFVHVMHRADRDERVGFFFTAERWQGEPHNAEPEKCSELLWAPLDQLPEDLVPYVRHAIDAWRAGVRYAEFGWP